MRLNRKATMRCFLVEIAVIIALNESTLHAICMRDATCLQCKTDNASGDSSTMSNQEPRTGCISQACSLLQGRKCTSFGAGIFFVACMCPACHANNRCTKRVLSMDAAYCKRLCARMTCTCHLLRNTHAHVPHAPQQTIFDTLNEQFC